MLSKILNESEKQIHRQSKQITKTKWFPLELNKILGVPHHKLCDLYVLLPILNFTKTKKQTCMSCMFRS